MSGRPPVMLAPSLFSHVFALSIACQETYGPCSELQDGRMPSPCSAMLASMFLAYWKLGCRAPFRVISHTTAFFFLSLHPVEFITSSGIFLIWPAISLPFLSLWYLQHICSLNIFTRLCISMLFCSLVHLIGNHSPPRTKEYTATRTVNIVFIHQIWLGFKV